MDVFCKIINKELPTNSFYEDDDFMGIMDVNPNSPGHFLIIPKKHVTDIIDLDQELAGKLFKLVKKYIKVMMDVYPDIKGVHTAINYGDLQVVKHLHVHLIPYYDEEPSLSQETACMLLKKSTD